jgi:hypothetical protein
MTVLLGTPTISMPPELASDVLQLDEPLPDPESIAAIVDSQVVAFRQECERQSVIPPTIDDSVLARACDALLGLAAYPSEQTVAMALSRAGLDVGSVWERKRQLIASARGLSVYRGSETFADVRGNANAIQALKDAFNPSARIKYRAIVFADEIEKSVAGTGDTSGISQEQLKELLTEMQDTDATGVLYVSPPGCGKSMLAKCAGNFAGVPLIQYNLGEMKGQFVGVTGENQRNAHKVIRAVAQGPAYWIATSNAVANLPPELRRRFADGTYYFDLPNASEGQALWDKYRADYQLTDPIPFGADNSVAGWTGAEIRNACRMAYAYNIPLASAAGRISPVCKSAREAIRKLRMEASGNYVSANYPGVYQYDDSAVTVTSVRSFAGGL